MATRRQGERAVTRAQAARNLALKDLAEARRQLNPAQRALVEKMKLDPGVELEAIRRRDELRRGFPTQAGTIRAFPTMADTPTMEMGGSWESTPDIVQAMGEQLPGQYTGQIHPIRKLLSLLGAGRDKFGVPHDVYMQPGMEPDINKVIDKATQAEQARREGVDVQPAKTQAPDVRGLMNLLGIFQ